MAAPRTRRLTRAVLLAALSAVLLVPGTATAATGDLIPDLGIRRIQNISVANSGGRRLLRFSTTIVNLGEGRFVLHGFRDSSSDPSWDVRQKIRNADGGYRWVDTTAGLLYEGDGHDHWHVRRVASYDLYALGDEVSLRQGAKVGFCFFDTTPIDTSLPGAPGSPRYRESTCGTRTATHVWMGLSVGWGDTYPWNFYKQWIDITGIASGDYRLCVTADKAGRFLELDEDNNQSYVDIRISGSGVTLLGSKARGVPCLGG